MENGESRRRNIRLNRAHLVRKFLEDLYGSLVPLFVYRSLMFHSLSLSRSPILVTPIKIAADDIEHVGA